MACFLAWTAVSVQEKAELTINFFVTESLRPQDLCYASHMLFIASEQSSRQCGNKLLHLFSFHREAGSILEAGICQKSWLLINGGSN